MQKDTQADKTSSGSQPAALEAKIVNLTQTLETFSAEIESLKTNLQKRKSENTTLKVLVYTGLIVLVLGSYYTSSSLQKAHLKSMETHMTKLQTRMNAEMVAMEKTLHGRLDSMGQQITKISEQDAQNALDRMNHAISRLNPKDAKTAALINDVLKNSRALKSLYSEQAAPAAAPKKEDTGDVLAQHETD